MPSTPLVISHRTNMGTLPENTLAGIEGAISDLADGVEIDVRATADGELVLLHDAALERTTDGAGALAEHTLAELTGVRVSPLHAYQQPQPIPTLPQALAAVGGRAILVIEIKEPNLEERVAALIDQAGASDWCWVWSFAPEVCAAMHEAAPELPVSLNWGRASAERSDQGPIERALELGIHGVSFDHRMLEADTVTRAHEAGLHVSTWTVNEVPEIDRVRDAGVDAICGDVPSAIAARVR
jgi:glycerophosphoryl diester phosphodiesterase